MIVKIWKLAAVLAVILTYALVNLPTETPPTPTITVPQADETSGRNIFNEEARLSPDQIDYIPANYPLLLPDYANPETTPTVVQDDVRIPEEAPNGGHFTEWLDNSPHYSDGYTLFVNDSADPITVTWRYDGTEDN